MLNPYDKNKSMSVIRLGALLEHMLILGSVAHSDKSCKELNLEPAAGPTMLLDYGGMMRPSERG